MAPCLPHGSTDHSMVIVLELAEDMDAPSPNPVLRAEYTQPRPHVLTDRKNQLGQPEPLLSVFARALRHCPLVMNSLDNTHGRVQQQFWFRLSHWSARWWEPVPSKGLWQGLSLRVGQCGFSGEVWVEPGLGKDGFSLRVMF